MVKTPLSNVWLNTNLGKSAGLQAGDIVTGFNGVPISDATDLTAQVRAAAAGSDATVTFVRDGQTRTVDVTLGQLGS